MGGVRYLVVNADDFGLSPGVNRGVVEAHERGIVTSASLLVRWPAAAQAADYTRSRPALSVGLHLDLGEWAYRGGQWVALYEVVRPDDPCAVSDEAQRQLTAFRQMTGRDPTHLDSHQHVHREGPACGVLRDMARRLGVPLRHFSVVCYCGSFYGQTGKGEPFPEAIEVEALKRILASLPAGVTELACHPGHGKGLDSMYREERAREVAALCDPAVRAALEAEGICLVSFAGVPADLLSAKGGLP
jgi:predicted glycoside hydrolase/deacetylase ChbG (UPF0249 family)